MLFSLILSFHFELKLYFVCFFKSSKRKCSPEKQDAEVKRQRKNEGGDPKEEGDEEEERVAEEKLKRLQELADRCTTERKGSGCPSASSSLVQKGCPKSSWQQIGNLLIYTAAAVKGSGKVGPSLLIQHL